MRFRIKKGQHTEDGKVYTAGEVVNTDVDLVRAYNCVKFERLPDLPEEEEAFDYGEDVTGTFNGAKELNVSVHHRGREYFVMNNDDGEPVHAEPITRKTDVIQMLQGMR